MIGLEALVDDDFKTEPARSLAQKRMHRVHARSVGLGENAHAEFTPALRLTLSGFAMLRGEVCPGVLRGLLRGARRRGVRNPLAPALVSFPATEGRLFCGS